MSEDVRTCDRCGEPIEGPGSVTADYGQDLCLGCVHPAYRRDRQAA
jgi:formylmethanofuran dehydrogenase subunit E